jgi:hypothetical protein
MSSLDRQSAAEIMARIIRVRYSAQDIASKVAAIHDELLRVSGHVRTGNFTVISPSDLFNLFNFYDGQFFAGDLRRLLDCLNVPVRFTLSARMTRSAGLTKGFAPPRRPGMPPGPATRYEISLSTHLLFSTFDDIDRIVRVNGLVCKDRLEATQRVFEHEIIHLIEMLVWNQSSCSGERFRSLVWNVFAHPETRHDLVTQAERARTVFDVRVGDRVVFEWDGATIQGVINRITRRATVLVERSDGQLYADGKRYVKYYVPLKMLRKANET